MVIATTADANASMTVNNITTTSGSPSAPVALNVGSTTISILVTAQNGTTVKAYSIVVTRDAPPAALFVTGLSNQQFSADDKILVHTALSPNGDGLNDFLKIDGIEAYPNNKLLIMNSNGVKVFEASGYDNSSRVFNGHSSITGAFSPQGTYFYSLEYKIGDTVKHKTGYIVLKY
jgi:gliding motility-associated-like protein